jgi:hypothetical protein
MRLPSRAVREVDHDWVGIAGKAPISRENHGIAVGNERDGPGDADTGSRRASLRATADRARSRPDRLQITSRSR